MFGSSLLVAGAFLVQVHHERFLWAGITFFWGGWVGTVGRSVSRGAGGLACGSFFCWGLLAWWKSFPKRMGSWKVLQPHYQFLGDSNKQQMYGDFEGFPFNKCMKFVWVWKTCLMTQQTESRFHCWSTNFLQLQASHVNGQAIWLKDLQYLHLSGPWSGKPWLQECCFQEKIWQKSITWVVKTVFFKPSKVNLCGWFQGFFSSSLGKWSNLTKHICFKLGWFNHQLGETGLGRKWLQRLLPVFVILSSWLQVCDTERWRWRRAARLNAAKKFDKKISRFLVGNLGSYLGSIHRQWG